MAIREIVTAPTPVLRKKAHKVTAFDRELQQLIDDMVESMRDAPGVGLAAPQIGVSLRVVVVEYGAEDDEEAPLKLYTVVNPEITRAADETITGTEGCLSVPGYAGDVERLAEITVRGQNRLGKTVRIKAKGWLARIFQHEIDHLDGILYTDRASRIFKLDEEMDQSILLD